jgi:Flp pilus assembly protein TadG
MFMVTHTLRRRRHRGAAAVEFALVVPLLVMILFGIMEFGYAFFIQASVAGAAREGVRSYAINWTKASAQSDAIARAESAPGLVPGDFVNATISPSCTTTTAGSRTTLTLTYKYRSLTGLLDGILASSNITLTGIGSMACGG